MASIFKRFFMKGVKSDADLLRRKILVYSIAEVVLLLLLVAFSFFLFRILVV